MKIMGKPPDVLIEKKLDFIWITLPGNMNSDNYLHIENQICDNLEQNNKQNNLKAVIDFQETKYLYSSGIGVIIRTRNLVIKKKGEVWLVNVSEKCRDALISMKLDKIFPIFSTDLEFELSQDSIWEDKLAADPDNFLCVHHIENDICRINITGKMVILKFPTLNFDSIFNKDISYYVFDLTGLEMIDSNGAYIFLNLILEFKKHNAICTMYGGKENITELLELLGFNEYLTCYENENEALKALQANEKK